MSQLNDTPIRWSWLRRPDKDQLMREPDRGRGEPPRLSSRQVVEGEASTPGTPTRRSSLRRAGRVAEPSWRAEAELNVAEAPDDAMLLAFKIPEAPYSDEAFTRVHHALEAVEAVHATTIIFPVALGGLLELGLIAGAGVAAALSPFFAVGSGYAAARDKVSRERMRSGFAIGVVTGASRAGWPFVKRLFWMYHPDPSYTFDEGNRVVAQKAFNLGLASGFIQGQQVTRSAKKLEFFWQSIRRAFTAGDNAQFSGDQKRWPDRRWLDYYYRVAGLFANLYLEPR
jgi:hypothetical protein